MHINNPDFRDGVDQRDEDQQEESIVKFYPENPCFFDFVFHGLEAQGVEDHAQFELKNSHHAFPVPSGHCFCVCTCSLCRTDKCPMGRGRCLN